MTEFFYFVSAGDVAIFTLIMAVTLSLWGIFFISLFRNKE